MNTKQSYLKKLSRFYVRKKIYKESDKIVLGLSGGPDSVFLLLLLNDLKLAVGFGLSVVHVNHQLRSDSSERDQIFVQNLTECLKVPLKVSRVDVRSFAEKTGQSIEMSARHLRYEVFMNEAKRLDANIVATAHTADDRVETALMRIVSGCGLTGLTGLRLTRRWENILLSRPLIRCWKKELLKYLNANNVEFCHDESNLLDEFTRNRLRNNLIPYLEQNFNPNFKNTFTKTLDLLESQADSISEVSDKKYAEAILKRDRIHIFDKNILSKFSKGIIGEILLKSIFEITDVPIRPAYKHLVSLIENLSRTTTGEYLFPSNIRAVVDRRYVVVGIKKDLDEFLIPEKWEETLDIPCEILIDRCIKTRIEVSLLKNEKTDVFYKNFWTDFMKGEEVYLSTVVGIPKGIGKLKVRFRKQGDVVQSACGRKKLKKCLIDKKVPSLLKDVLPIILCENIVVWFPGKTDQNSVAPDKSLDFIRLDVCMKLH